MYNMETETIGVGTTPRTSMIPVKKGGISSTSWSFVDSTVPVTRQEQSESQSAALENSPELYMCDKN